MLLFIGDDFIVQHQRVIHVIEIDLLAAREDLMPPMLLVPFGKRRGHVHLLDDIAPSHARVVSAERNLTFLRGVRNNALLRPPEVVVEQILEPHARDEQEVPSVLPPLDDIVDSPIGPHLPVILPGSIEVLIKLLQQIHQLEMRRRLERIVILHQTKSHSNNR